MKNLTKIDKIVFTIALFFAIWAAIAIPMRIYTWYSNQEIFEKTEVYSVDQTAGYGGEQAPQVYYEEEHPILSDKLIEDVHKRSFIYAAIIYPITLLIIGTITLIKRKTSSKC